MQVREVMTAELRSCHPEEPLLEVAARLAESGGGSFVVVSSDEKSEPVGMLTLRDLTRAIARETAPFEELEVSNVMSRIVHACRADDKLWEACELMQLHGVRHLPVLDADGRVAGMLSVTDLARATVAEQPSASEVLSPYAVCRILLTANEDRTSS
jgi:CBS domain-containing protein